jgi:hypothetical protein
MRNMKNAYASQTGSPPDLTKLAELYEQAQKWADVPGVDQWLTRTKDILDAAIRQTQNYFTFLTEDTLRDMLKGQAVEAYERSHPRFVQPHRRQIEEQRLKKICNSRAAKGHRETKEFCYADGQLNAVTADRTYIPPAERQALRNTGVGIFSVCIASGGAVYHLITGECLYDPNAQEEGAVKTTPPHDSLERRLVDSGLKGIPMGWSGGAVSFGSGVPKRRVATSETPPKYGAPTDAQRMGATANSRAHASQAPNQQTPFLTRSNFGKRHPLRIKLA